MYSIAVSLAAGVVVGLIVLLRYNVYAALFTGFFVAVLVAFVLLRRFTGKLQEIQARAMKHLEELQGNTNKQLEKQKFELSIKTLEEGFRYKHWMVLGTSQINGQIGYIHYLRKEFDKAFPYLKDSFVKNWMAQLMLAAIYYRRKEYAQMEEVLERTTKHNKKVPLVWAVYAWLEDEIGKSDAARDLLSKGVAANPEDETLKANLLNLQNKKKMKMTKFAEMWYQLHLEAPPMRLLQPQQPRFSAFRRR